MWLYCNTKLNESAIVVKMKSADSVIDTLALLTDTADI